MPDEAFKAYFISDLHLSSPEEPRMLALLRFLRGFNSTEQLTHLFLLGDIFDLWIGKHAYFLERWLPVTTELLRLHQLGVEIHYFEGNHDLYLASYYGEQLGFKVHSEAVNLRIGPWRLRLEHGDQMDPEDRGYLFLRWLLRTPLVRALEPRLPDRFLVRLGERMSGASRHYTSARKTISDAVAKQKIRAHAERVRAQEPFDYLIAGHLHVRDEHSLPVSNGGAAPVVVNLGSWLHDDYSAYCLTAKGGEFIPIAAPN